MNYWPLLFSLSLSLMLSALMEKKNLDNRRASTIKARGVKKDAIDGDYTDNDTRTHWYYHVCTPSECSVSMAPRILSKTL